MVRLMERMWIRVGIYSAIVVFLSVSITAISIYLDEKHQNQLFLAGLPPDIHQEMMALIATGKEKSPRANAIYSQYWNQDGPGISIVILYGLAISFCIGVVAAFVSSRIFVRPLSSVIEASAQIAKGNLGIRAHQLSSIGELNKLVQNFNQMADALEQLEKERKDSAAAISHELRTPLTILQTRLHALCDGVIAPSNAEHNRLLKHTEHLVRLVEDLYTLSLVESGRLSLCYTYFELSAFIHEVVPFYQHRANAYGVKIETKLSPAFIYADRDRLRQVITNIIENTLHYAAGGGLLEIAVRQEDQYAILELSDHGSGISSNDIKWIFDPFFRGDNSSNKLNKGLGLGLSIVQSIIKQHNGTIHAFNQDAGGACFTIRLPISAPMPD